MRPDVLDRLKWHLRLGAPGPVEQAAVAVAAMELDEADVDLPTWRRAAAGDRDDAQARERYVRLRVADLRRELRARSAPLLEADQLDREWWGKEVHRRADAFRASPEGEEAYRATLSIALRGLWTFSLLYFAALLLIVAVVYGLWLVSA